MTLVLYLENLFMYCSLTIKKGRAHCSLWASWGLPVRMGGPPATHTLPALPLLGTFSFTLQRWGAASLEKPVCLAGHSVQRPWFLVVVQTWPWLSVCSPTWGRLGIFHYLLVLHFVDCFVSLGLSLVSVSLSHLAASSYSSQITCSVPSQHECRCGSGHGYDWQAQGKGSLGPGTQVLLSGQTGLIGNRHLQV